MKTQCPHCNATFKASDKYTGKEVKCPKCKQGFVVSLCSSEKPTPPPVISNIPDDALPESNISLTAEDYARKIKLQKEKQKRKRVDTQFQTTGSVLRLFIDILLFRRMIFPWLIIIFFAICFGVTVGFTVTSPLFDVIFGPYSASSEPLDSFAYEPPFIVRLLSHPILFAWICLLWLRVISEWLILFFRIHQDVKSISDKIKAMPENQQEQRAIA